VPADRYQQLRRCQNVLIEFAAAETHTTDVRIQRELTYAIAEFCKIRRNSDFALLENASIQGVSRLEDITAGGDFLGPCDQKGSYKHVSDFGRLRSYDRLKLRREGNDY
jgi:hypothetical protein